jgi:hypothetical protein
MTPAFAVAYLIGSLAVGIAGRRRRIGFVGFLIVSLLITPPLALLVLWLTGFSPSRRTV